MPSPPPPSAPTPAEEARTWQELLFSLHHRDHPTLVFMECGSLARRAELEAQLRRDLPEYQFRSVDLTPYPVISLLRALRERLPAEVTDSAPVTYVVHVHGLENSLLVSEGGELKPSLLTAQLNLERELLFRNVPYVIMLWGDAQFFRTLQREALDLWDWVTYKFRFADPTAQPPEALPPLPPERLRQQGNVAARQDRIRELEDRYQHLALDTSDKIRLIKEKINIQSLLGAEYAEAFQFEQAADAYRTAIQLQKNLGIENESQGALWFELGWVYHRQRRWAAALDAYAQSRERSTEANYGSIYHQIGWAYADQRQWNSALDNYQQSLKWQRKTGNEFRIGYTYHQIGWAYAEQRQWTSALENYEQALKRYQQKGNKFALGMTYHQIGMVYAEQRQWASALKNYQQALHWHQQTGNEFELGSTYHQIGIAYAEQQQWASALDNYQQALKWHRQTGNEFKIGETYHQIGMAYAKQRQWSSALENYQQALKWYQQIGNEFAIGSTYHQLGIAYAEQKQWISALDSYQQALKWHRQTGNEFALGSTFYQIGELHEEQGQLLEAREWYENAILNLAQSKHLGLPIAQEALKRVHAKLAEDA